MFVFTATLILIAVLAYLFLVRGKDLPEPAAVLPYAHLEARKGQIYENLRDLQFEYRVGKLSDSDYQATKTGLQTELAGVLAEIDRLKGAAPEPVKNVAVNGKRPAAKNQCPHCGAKFSQSLKFCGECGKPMEVRA